MHSLQWVRSIGHSLLSRSICPIRYASSLVIGDYRDGKLTKNTASAISVASQLGDPSLLLMDATLTDDLCKSLSKELGVKECFYSNSSDRSSTLPENCYRLLQDLQKKYSYNYIIGCSTITMKTLLSRFSAKENTLMMSDIVRVIDSNTFQRYVYAGNAIETVKNTSNPIVMTVRTSKFISTDIKPVSDSVITKVDIKADSRYSTFKEEIKTKTDRPELSQADRVVVGGRGVGKKEQFKELYDLADKLHAAVGGTRAVVDQDMIEANLQVGQTGKVISPSLYIGCGVSGSIQHQAGMKDSQTIVCINKDPEAPLFNIADFGIVGDLHEIVPELTSKL